MDYTLLLPLLLTVLVIVGIVFYNRIVKRRTLTEEAWAGVEACLQQRNDLIPSLVETVKGYAGHELTVLTEVVKWRNQSTAAASPGEQLTAQAGLSRALPGIFALSEQYPELKADRNFARLHSDLSDIEEKINHARRYYNGTVRDFNTAIVTFPGVVLATMLQIRRADFFEAEEGASAVPRVDFSSK